MRSQGGRPAHTLADVLDLASIEEDPSTPADDEMVEGIIKDLSTLDEQVQQLADRVEEAEDSGTVTVLEDLSE